MSTLGFDPRPYCERLAKASDRFDYLFEPSTGYWQCNDLNNEATVFHGSDAANLAAFFVPLADECKIDTMRVHELVDHLPCRTWLESIIAAVVEWFESQNESEAKNA